MGLPARSVDISRGDHGRGYGDPENVVLLEPASRNRARGSRPMTVATQDELVCSPGGADDQPPELTPEEDRSGLQCAVLLLVAPKTSAFAFSFLPGPFLVPRAGSGHGQGDQVNFWCYYLTPHTLNTLERGYCPIPAL